MGWVSRLLARGPHKGPTKQRDAYQLGREIAAATVKQVDRFLERRCLQFKHAYLHALHHQVTASIGREDHSPVLLARAEYALFVDECSDIEKKITAEAIAYIDEWRSEVGLHWDEKLVRHYTEAKLNGFAIEIIGDGLALVTSRTEELQAADRAWRVAHPDQAALEPLNQ